MQLYITAKQSGYTLTHMERHGQAWTGMGRYGQVWTDRHRYGQAWADMNRQARYGQAWADMDRHGLNVGPRPSVCVWSIILFDAETLSIW